MQILSFTAFKNASNLLPNCLLINGTVLKAKTAILYFVAPYNKVHPFTTTIQQSNAYATKGNLACLVLTRHWDIYIW